MESPANFVDISSPFSPIYWGFVLSLLFGGVTIVQAYIYFLHSRDRLEVKLLATFISVLDFVDSVLVAYSIYYFLIPQFGSLFRLSFLPWELTAECILASIITVISQMYFVYQLVAAKRFGHGNWFVIVTIGILSCISLAGGIACVVSMSLFDRGVLANRNHIFSIAFGFSKGFSALADILATIAMCIFLKSARVGLSRTNSLLNDLVRVIFMRGVLVTIAQTLLVISFYALPTRLTWMAFHINVAKLYVNTFFAMLNGREHLREKHLGATSVQLSDNTKQSRSNRVKSGIHVISQQSESKLSCPDDQSIEDTNKSNTVFMNTVVTTSLI
ncbi:hypothetical protein HYPSUDRAFT_161287 [Hypholoma sublateritium FD-334 SS-4]|uniref:DUF6534 domain-containing protein n=1 Tax=Hypholoma sublateritium (strain FD-334 SS-4) TaxID=945553 RepID=A0A0D2P2I5_HYPSF|nr:hypothetical protein HYPSUDRAFT_161287 [Hypholoma sublateritium FD-334 SS-4]